MDNFDSLIRKYCKTNTYIIFGSVCDESSVYWNNICFFKEELAIPSPKYRQGLVFIYDVSKQKIDSEYSKNVSMTYSENNYEFLIESRGYIDDVNRGSACFYINKRKYELMHNRGLNILVWDKEFNRIVDLFSVDLFLDPELNIKRIYPSDLSDLTYILNGNELFSFEITKIKNEILTKTLVGHYPILEGLPFDRDSSFTYHEIVKRTGISEYLPGSIQSLITNANPSLLFDNQVISYSLYHSVYSPSNQKLAKKYQRKAACLYSSSIQGLLRLNTKISEMDYVLIVSTNSDYCKIICSCIQNYVQVDYYCPLDPVVNTNLLTEIIDKNKIEQLEGKIGIIYHTNKLTLSGDNIYYFDYERLGEGGLFVISSNLYSNKSVSILNDKHTNEAIWYYQDLMSHTIDASIVSTTLRDVIPKETAILCLTQNIQMLNNLSYYRLYIDFRLINDGNQILKKENGNWKGVPLSELCRRYELGKKEYEKLDETQRYCISRWSAVGDMAKISSLLSSISFSDIFLIPPNKKFLNRLFPKIRYQIVDEETFASLKIYMELNFYRERGKLNYWTLGGSDSFILSGFVGYKPMNDHDMLCNLLDIPSTTTYEHVTHQTVKLEYSNTILLVPDAGWTYSQSGSEAYVSFMDKLLNELCDYFLSKGYRVLSNTKGKYFRIKNAEGITLDLETLVSIAPSLKAAIGPMTGLFDLLALSDCKNIQVVYGNRPHIKWYDLERLLLPTQKYRPYFALSEDYNRIFDCIIKEVIND